MNPYSIESAPHQACPDRRSEQTLRGAEIILSIKPKYVDMIFAETKRVELRKRNARIRPGTRVLIYATSPRAALVGEMRVSFRELLPLDELWARYAPQAAVSRHEFDIYYAGADAGVVLGLEGVTRYDRSVPLSVLRAAEGGFRPPQSYMRAPISLVTMVQNLGSTTAKESRGDDSDCHRQAAMRQLDPEDCKVDASPELDRLDANGTAGEPGTGPTEITTVTVDVGNGHFESNDEGAFGAEGAGGFSAEPGDQGQGGI